MEEFRDLEPWQSARSLMKEIYRYTTQGSFNKDPWLREQVRSTCAAIMYNIAQSLGCNAELESKSLLGLAQRACCALRSHLYIALDQHYLSEQEFMFLSDAANSIHNMLHHHMRTGGRIRSESTE